MNELITKQNFGEQIVVSKQMWELLELRVKELLEENIALKEEKIYLEIALSEIMTND